MGPDGRSAMSPAAPPRLTPLQHTPPHSPAPLPPPLPAPPWLGSARSDKGSAVSVRAGLTTTDARDARDTLFTQRCERNSKEPRLG